MRKHRMTTTGAIAAMIFAAIGIAQAANASTLSDAKERGFIRAAFANEAPYGFINEDNELTGESPEVGMHVLQQMGIENMDGVLTEWSSLIPGLKAHRWDMVAAGMFITPKRCAQVDFSNPTYMMGSSMLVQAGNPNDIHSYQDIAENADITLAVLAGAVEYGYAKKAGIPDSQIKQVPNQSSMLASVRAGRVDAGALTSVSIERMARRGGPKVQRVKDFQAPDYTIGYGAFAFRESADELRKAFNEHLAHFIGSPEHLALVKPFGFTEANLPGDATAKELCPPE